MTDLDKLIPSLIRFQSVVKSPAKTKTNPHLQNRYADLSDIIDVIREPLSQNGLAFSQLVNAGVLTTILMHESGQSLTAETSLMIDKQTMQGMGSAITYARRYALSAILGIAADDDDDGNGASQARAKAPAQATTPASTNERLPASPASPVMASEAQRRKIDSLRSELGWSAEDTKAEIALTYKVGSSKELELKQAKDFIDRLEKLKAAKNEPAA